MAPTRDPCQHAGGMAAGLRCGWLLPTVARLAKRTPLTGTLHTWRPKRKPANPRWVHNVHGGLLPAPFTSPCGLRAPRSGA